MKYDLIWRLGLSTENQQNFTLIDKALPYVCFWTGHQETQCLYFVRLNICIIPYVLRN